MFRHVVVVLVFLLSANVWAQEDHLTKLFEVHSKFAAMGSAEAQYKLGQMYEEGQGTQVDFAKAREWYEKAAAQGYDKAKERLEVLNARAVKAGSDAAAQEAAAAQKRAAEEKARQEAAAAQKRATEEKARQEAVAAQKRAEEEKARQEAVAAQKRAEEEKARQASAPAKPAVAPKAEAQPAAAGQPETFETDPCNTPAARFMSTCRDKK